MRRFRGYNFAMSPRKRWILLVLGAINLALLATFGWMMWSLPKFPGPGTPISVPPSPAQSEAAVPTRAATPTRQPPTTIRASPLPTIAITPTPTEIAASCVITTSGGLITEIQAIVAAMPGKDSDGMAVPSDAQMAAWETLVQALAAGDTAATCGIIQSEGFSYHIERFTDLPFEREQYLILRENSPAAVGWGTVVVRLGEAKGIVVEAPHPLADERTEVQAATLFRELRAQAMIVAGAHRCADAAFSPCLGLTIACGQQEPYRASDVAHAAQTMFQAAHRALVPCGGETVAIQLHTNSLAACPDVFLSNGTLHPGPLAMRLYEKTAEHCGDFAVDVADGQPGDSSPSECGFPGDGVQAVYSNSCGLASPPDACTGYASQVYGPETFINIEQSPAFREDFTCLVDALKEVFEVTSQ